MAVEARALKQSVLVQAELVHGVIHDRVAEHSRGDERLEVLDREARDLLEQARLQLRDHVLEALLAVVREAHGRRSACTR